MITELTLAATLLAGAPADDRQPDWNESSLPYGEATHKVEHDDPLHEYIEDAREVMEDHGIPGSHHDIRRNVMRESSGDPNAINRWDSNADNGIPSKGLLQTIPSTFRAYHVDGTSKNIYDPVANIVAACNYAADRYGSINNVHGAY